MVLDEFFSAALELDAVGEVLPEDVAIGFVLDGPGGGTWTISRREGTVRAVRELVEPLDCKLTCDADDFRALLRGELDGIAGFMSGRLVIEGDVGLVLGLQQATLNR